MKFSDYLNVDPSPKKVTQTFNMRDENREAILEQKIADLTSRLTKFTDQAAELEHSNKQRNNLASDKRELSNQLDNTQSTVDTLHSQLENEFQLKQNIKALESQLTVHQQHLEEVRNKSNVDDIHIAKQEKEILDLTAEKLLLETYQQELQLKSKYAEQKQTDALNELKYIKQQFSSVEESSTQLMNDYVAVQKDLSSNIDQRRGLRQQVRMLEEEVEAGRILNGSLHDSVVSLQDFYESSQNQLTVSESTSSKLDDTIKNLTHTLTNLEQENTYLLNKQKYLEAALAKPKYMSQSVIERQEGFKMPLAASALNIRKNYLGTGKPTLLKFKKKELVNDNA
tara:strand:+ start:408 stop:1427 length:1020 start_codon:yes stop_codon:yes gene_type:complete